MREEGLPRARSWKVFSFFFKMGVVDCLDYGDLVCNNLDYKGDLKDVNPTGALRNYFSCYIFMCFKTNQLFEPWTLSWGPQLEISVLWSQIIQDCRQTLKSYNIL